LENDIFYIWYLYKTVLYKDITIRETFCSVISVGWIGFASAKWMQHFSSKVDDFKDRKWERYAV